MTAMGINSPYSTHWSPGVKRKLPIKCAIQQNYLSSVIGCGELNNTVFSDTSSLI